MQSLQVQRGSIPASRFWSYSHFHLLVYFYLFCLLDSLWHFSIPPFQSEQKFRTLYLVFSQKSVMPHALQFITYWELLPLKAIRIFSNVFWKGPTLAVLRCRDNNLSCFSRRGHQEPPRVVSLAVCRKSFWFCTLMYIPWSHGSMYVGVAIVQATDKSTQMGVQLHLLILSNVHQVQFSAAQNYSHCLSLAPVWKVALAKHQFLPHQQSYAQRSSLVGGCTGSARGAWQQPWMNYKQTPSLSHLK